MPKRKRMGRGDGGNSSTDIHRALSGLQSYLARLRSERTAIDQRIASIDAAVRSIGAGGRTKPAAAPAPSRPAGAPAARATRRIGRAGPGRRPPGATLKDFIVRVLGANGGVMAVKDIASAVRRAGFPTKNKALAKSVGNALAKMSNVARVGRGKFRLKK